MNLKNILILINDPYNAKSNFNLGYEYEQLGQTASAISFYLRCAEYAKDKLLSYESLLRVFLCLEKQGSRQFVSKGVLLRAISLIPTRPEAYFLMARHLERCRQWNDSYTYACIGLSMKDYKSLKTDVEYLGKYVLTFEKAVAGWWIGLYDESIYLHRQLLKNPEISFMHKNVITNNLAKLSNNWKDPIEYNDSMYERYKFKFQGLKDIKRNYSQCFQDLFVLTMLNGKTYGRYIEIGSGDPYYGSNTALLEKLGWTGLSLEIDPNLVNRFKETRRNDIVLCDALSYKYELSGNYDYLQVDCDPAINSLNALMNIPLEKLKFAVITFEHDEYQSDDIVKIRAREYLQSFGYELIVSNVAPDNYNSFEDWFINPELVNNKIITKIKDTSDTTKNIVDFLFN